MDILKAIKNNAPSILAGAATTAMGLGPVGLLAGPGIRADLQRRRLGREQMALDNEIKRRAIEQDKRQSSAIDQLPGVLSAYTEGDPIAAQRGAIEQYGMLGTQGAPLPPSQGEREANLMGVLGQIAPAYTANSILGKINPREPAIIQQLRAAGIDPQSEQGRQLIAQSAGQNGIMDQLKMMQMQLQIRGMQDELSDEQRDRDTEQSDVAASFNSVGDNLLRLNDYLTEAEDASLVKPGGFAAGPRKAIASAFAWGADLVGADDLAKELENDIKAYEGIDKESATLVGNLIEQANALGINVTKSLQGVFERSTPGTDIQVGTSKAMARVMAKEILDAADRKRVDLRGRRALEKMAYGGGEFKTIAEAEQAAADGMVEKGDVVYINGRRAVWE